MKIKDLPENDSLLGVRFIYPKNGKKYHWFSQWEHGVFGKKNMNSTKFEPLFCSDLKEALDWEVCK